MSHGHEDSHGQAEEPGLDHSLASQPSKEPTNQTPDFLMPKPREDSFPFVVPDDSSSVKGRPRMQSDQRWDLGEAGQTAYSFLVSLRTLSSVPLSYLKA